VKRVNEGAAIANVELDVNGQRVVASITVSGPLLGGHGGVESRSTPWVPRDRAGAERVRLAEPRVAGSSLEVGVTYLENERLRGGRELPLYDEWYLLLTAGDGPSGAADELGWREAADERLCLLTPDMQNRRIVDGAFAAAARVRARSSRRTRSRRCTRTCVPVSWARWWRTRGCICIQCPRACGGAAGAARHPPVDRLVWPDDRAEPLPTRALITTVREVDLVAVLDRGAASGR
jgi:hypothetical protein